MARDSLVVHHWFEEGHDIVRIAVNGPEGYMNFEDNYLLEDLIKLDEEIDIGPKVIVEWSK